MFHIGSLSDREQEHDRKPKINGKKKQRNILTIRCKKKEKKLRTRKIKIKSSRVNFKPPMAFGTSDF